MEDRLKNILVIQILLAVFEYIKIYLNDQKVNNQKAFIEKKVSEFVSNIIKDTNLLTDHRNDKNYKLWNLRKIP